jgi:hypothetical protein
MISLCISMNLRSNENLRAGKQLTFLLAAPSTDNITDMAVSLVGLVKWSLDICIYLLQELFRISDLVKHAAYDSNPGKEKDREWLQQNRGFL